MNSELLIMLKESLGMFLFLGVELTLLFLAISYLVGVIQDFVPAERIQVILSSKNGKGYLSASLLGSITPFCSCSTIPMLSGLLKAKAGFGPTLTFLFTSPLLNPIVIGLFLVTFGLKATFLYAVIALVVAIAAGYILEKLDFERFIKKSSTAEKPESNNCCESGLQNDVIEPERLNDCDKESETANTSCQTDRSGDDIGILPLENRWIRIWRKTSQQFISVLPYLLIAIGIGAFTYGFVPAEFIAQYAGGDNPLAIPVAAVIGIPLYIQVSAMIPLTGVLVAKGMGIGAVMALIIGSAGASITEVILLKALFKRQMIMAFLTVILGMAILTGFLFEWFL